MTSRKRSWSVIFSPARWSPVRATISRRNCSISSARHVAEVLVERFAGFELLAVDQQRARARQAVAVLVVVAEQLETAGDRASSVPSSFLRWKPEMKS